VATGGTVPGFDGTTGGTEHGGRRTHIIQILRDAKEPLSVAEVADMVGVHINTARFHLESLVDAGLATREAEARQAPGRRRILYAGTLPNQTHERAQGYRLLAGILTTAIAAQYPDVGAQMYQIGTEWGRFLAAGTASDEIFDEDEIARRVVDKLDALWFAPQLFHDPSPHLLLHNCPFAQSAAQAPQIVCTLHAGMVNGSLQELHSHQRVTDLWPQEQPHCCRADLGSVGEPDQMGVRLHLAEAAD